MFEDEKVPVTPDAGKCETTPQACPSCGGPPIDETDPNDLIHHNASVWWCACECGLSGPTCDSRAGAIAQWNMLSMTPAGDPHLVRVGSQFGPDDDSGTISVLVYGAEDALLPYRQQLAELHPVGTVNLLQAFRHMLVAAKTVAATRVGLDHDGANARYTYTTNAEVERLSAALGDILNP